MDTTIQILTRGLSDGSDVHDVVVTRYDHSIRFPAVTYEDAQALRTKIADAIEEHTVAAVDLHDGPY